MKLLEYIFKKPTPKGYFEVVKTKHDNFYFTLKTPEKRVVIKSKMYKTFEECWKGVEFVKANHNSKVWWNWRTE